MKNPSRNAIDQGSYFFSKAFRNIRLNLVATLISASTMGICLLILGTFLLTAVNIGKILQKWGEEIQVVTWLKEGISNRDLADTSLAIKKLPGVQGANYISKAEALKRFKEQLAGHSVILEGLEWNPLPASYELQLDPALRSAANIEALAKKLEALPAVEDVQYGQDWLEKLAAFSGFLKLAGLVAGIGLLLAVVFIIANTIKLTIHSRREEIEIMKLVGATDWFVRLPFFIEGVIQGAVAAVISLVFLFGLYYFTQLKLHGSFGMAASLFPLS